MERARLENLSFIYYLKNRVLLENFIERREEDSLIQESSTSYRIVVPQGFKPNPLDKGRGLVYFDEISIPGYGVIPDESAEQQNRVIVYNQSNAVISGSQYTIDYAGGRVLNPIGFTPGTITYYYNYVSVFEADQDLPESERKIDLPYIVVSSDGQAIRKGMQLGGGKIIPRQVNLHIYATDQAERNDLVQILMDGLEDREITVVDFNQTNGLQLNYDGTYNTNFSSTPSEEISGCMSFENITYRHLRGTRDYTYPERYRSTISLNLVTYVER